MRYELIILWYTGEKETHKYANEKDAEKGAENMRKAFGRQISWVGVRPILSN